MVHQTPDMSTCIGSIEIAGLHVPADDEVTASSLLTITEDGDVINPGVVGDIFGVNKAGFIIHSALHRARPDVRSVMHSHYAPAAGISAQRDGLKVGSMLCRISALSP